MPTALYYLHDPFAPDPNRPTRFGSAVIITAGNKILLEQRKDNFKWGIISGDINNTETFKECGIRQTIKETGIHIPSNKLHELKVFDDPSRIVSFLDGNIYRIVSFGFYCELDEPVNVKSNSQSIDIRWVDFDELQDYNIVVTHQEIIEEYFSKKNIEVELPKPGFLQ